METEENTDLEKVKELMDECDYNEAEKILKPLFKNDPNNVEILDYLGELYLNIGNYKGSKKMLEKSINLKPNENPDKYMDYAQLLDVPIKRVEAYKKAIELYINNLKNIKGNKKEKENKINDIKESISSAYSSIVSLYMTTDLCDDPNAEKIFENSIKEALQYCPDSIEALLQFSNLRIIRKRDNEAKEAMFKILEKIKKIDSGENIEQELPERDILINLSQNFAELKLFKEACYVINTLIKKDDEDIECYYLLAVYEDNNRNFFSSMEALEKFNKLYIKLQKNHETISPILQQYVDSAKALYNKLSKIKKDKLVDENPEDDDDNDNDNDDMEEDEDEEMK
jgi:predicted Zn-dependent protease